jgi:hypothetical protein
MNTQCGTVLRTGSPRILNYAVSDEENGTGGNFLLSHAMPWHIRMAQDITQQKLHDSRNVSSDQFNVQFRLQYGHKPGDDAHHFIFFHVRPANQQCTKTGVDLCHKNVGRPCFTETSVIPY